MPAASRASARSRTSASASACTSPSPSSRGTCSASTGANSTEMDPETPHPVIDLLPEQKEIEDLGGTMRLGAQAVELVEGTRAYEAYGEPVVHERHRHRYEVNNHYRPAARRGRARRVGDVSGRKARRDRRAVRSPVVRREPVPSGVQVAAHATGAALPRFRRRSARAVARTLCRRRSFRLAATKIARCRPRSSISSPSSPRCRALRAKSARWPTRHPLPARSRPGGGRGRCRRQGRLEHRELSTADSSRPAAAARSSSAPISTRCRRQRPIEPVLEDGVDPERRRHDPRGRQQVGGRRDARGRAASARREPPARGHRAAVHPEGGGRPPRRRGLRSRAPRRRASATSTTRRRRSARSSSARRTRGRCRCASTVAPRTRGCIRRRDARRSPPRRARSPISGSAASTKRRRQTSASSRAERPGTSSPSGAHSMPRRVRTTSRSSRSSCRRWSTPSPLRPGSRTARSRRRSRRATRAIASRRKTRSYELHTIALEKSGYAPTYALSGGAADANVFNERGLAVPQSRERDAGHPHLRRAGSPSTDLEGMVEVTLALVDVARDADA